MFLDMILLLAILAVNSFAQKTTESSILEGPSEDYVDRGQDGSYRFGYKSLDSGSHYHTAVASRDNTVSGRFGARDPASGRISQTTYTAGKRGFRARGPNIARQMDLSQSKIPYQPPVSPDSPNYQPTYHGYHDPNEDASYKFSLKTPTYSRGEASDSKGMVNGAYSYIDDVGKRHDVQYEAGSGTGFHVKNAFPDSEPYAGLFYRGPNKPGTPPRGHSSIVQGTDGAYQFTATGPDQKRIEVSDSMGRVRGSYTYIDDKGVQRTVQYVAGPNIGYKVIRKGTGPIYNPVFPYTNPEFLAPPLPSDSFLPSVSTSTASTTFASDLFEPSSSDFGLDIPSAEEAKPFDNTNEFLAPTNKPFTTSSYRPEISSERPNWWAAQPPNPFYTTLKPPKVDAPDFFTAFNPYKPSADGNAGPSDLPLRPGNHGGSSKPYDDLFGDKPTNFDSDDYKPKPSATYEPPKRPANTYLYPKPDKGFNEEPDRGFSGSENDNRYSETNRNFLRLPPGVTVKAHVQSLDILPYGSKIPPPEETLQRHLLEELRRER